MVTGMEDSGSNYARARYSRGMHIIPLLIDKVRYVAESCDGLQGFMLFSSFGGGTGSGLGALFLNRLEHEFHRRPRIHVGIFPGPDLSPVVVEPYNSILFASDLLELADFSILLDNTALFNIIKTSLGVDKPNYANLNKLSAQIISHLTSTLRFPNTLNNSLHEMQVNLIPYPQIKFPVSAFAPIQCADRNRHETMGTDILTKSVFSRSNLMVSCDLKKGLFMANSMIYRGPFDPVSVNHAIMCIKRDSNWVTWCPTGFKIGLSTQKPMFMNTSLLAPSDRSVFMISNTTSIRQVLRKLRYKCHLMHSKQAFVHHYVNEGLEEDELKLAYEEVAKLESLYKEIQVLDHDSSFEEPETPGESLILAEGANKEPEKAEAPQSQEAGEISEEEPDPPPKSEEEISPETCAENEIPTDPFPVLDPEVVNNSNNPHPDPMSDSEKSPESNLNCDNANIKTTKTLFSSPEAASEDSSITTSTKKPSKIFTKIKFHFSKLVKW